MGRPGDSGSIQARSSKSLGLGRVDFVLRSGRALLFPIYKGTCERGDDLQWLDQYLGPVATEL